MTVLSVMSNMAKTWPWREFDMWGMTYVLPTCNYLICCEVLESVTNCLMGRKCRGHGPLVICIDPVRYENLLLTAFWLGSQRIYKTCNLCRSCVARFVALVICVYLTRQVLPHLYFVYILWGMFCRTCNLCKSYEACSATFVFFCILYGNLLPSP